MRWLILLLFTALPALAQVTGSSMCSGSSGSSANSATCVAATVPANACIILSVLIDDDGTSTLGTPTGGGLTFVGIESINHNAGNWWYRSYRGFNTNSQSSITFSESWTGTAADWVMIGASFTGTAGTAGNNCSDGIGSSGQSAASSATTQSVTVTSSAHDRSKYFGVSIGAFASGGAGFTHGSGYTAVVASLFNTNFETIMSEISTSPVSPAANTAVTSTSTQGTCLIDGIEILVAGGGGGGGSTPPVGLIYKVAQAINRASTYFIDTTLRPIWLPLPEIALNPLRSRVFYTKSFLRLLPRRRYLAKLDEERGKQVLKEILRGEDSLLSSIVLLQEYTKVQ